MGQPQQTPPFETIDYNTLLQAYIEWVNHPTHVHQRKQMTVENPVTGSKPTTILGSGMLFYTSDFMDFLTHKFRDKKVEDTFSPALDNPKENGKPSNDDKPKKGKADTPTKD